MAFITSLNDYNKDFAINHVMGVEGGAKYTNIASDKGGATRYGITQAKANEHKDVWAKFKFNGDMSTLPQELAYYIYDVDYWTALKLDDIVTIHPLLADRLFDMAVNGGVGTAANALQRLINVFNVRGSLYPDIKVDCSIGNVTLSALKALVAKRGFDAKKALILGLTSLQYTRYIAIAESDLTQEDFSLGWANRVTQAYSNYLPLLKDPF